MSLMYSLRRSLTSAIHLGMSNVSSVYEASKSGIMPPNLALTNLTTRLTKLPVLLSRTVLFADTKAAHSN